MSENWNNRFLELAKLVSTWSKDPGTKCGCVIVRPDKTIASLGFNGFPRGMSDAQELYADRETKLSRVIHAEMNALLTAKESLTGYDAYIWPFSPCDRCTVHLIQAGIKRVFFPIADSVSEGRWKESFERACKYFEEAGVEVRVFPNV